MRVGDGTPLQERFGDADLRTGRPRHEILRQCPTRHVGIDLTRYGAHLYLQLHAHLHDECLIRHRRERAIGRARCFDEVLADDVLARAEANDAA